MMGTNGVKQITANAQRSGGSRVADLPVCVERRPRGAGEGWQEGSQGAVTGRKLGDEVELSVLHHRRPVLNPERCRWFRARGRSLSHPRPSAWPATGLTRRNPLADSVGGAGRLQYRGRVSRPCGERENALSRKQSMARKEGEGQGPRQCTVHGLFILS